MDAISEGLVNLLKAAGMEVTAWDAGERHVLIHARSTSTRAKCPACSRLSRRLHGTYARRLAELPCLDLEVTVELEVQRFKCSNPECSRRTFAESIDSFASKHQRRTRSHARALHAMGFALGGAAAARLATELGFRTSRQTVLRELHRAMNFRPKPPAPRVIGIDDWAITKGHRYGTIVVDLERRMPIEVFVGRETTAVAAWLREHPTVEIVARDRAGAYSEAIELGRPGAIQVADRWHLLDNLRTCVERMLNRMNARLREAAQQIDLEPASMGRQAMREGRRLHHWQRLSDDRRAARVAAYEDVRRRHRGGQNLREINRETSLHHQTIRKYLDSSTFPERAPRNRGPSPLDPFRAHIADRIAQGLHNQTVLWHEVRAAGYAGSREIVNQYVMRLLSPQTGESLVRIPARKMPCPSAARAFAWLAGWKKFSTGEAIKTIHRDFVRKLCELEPGVAVVQRLIKHFLGLLHQRDPKKFDRWLKAALNCGVPELRRFALHLKTDLAPVRAAFTLEWSNGQTEGQISRLKFIKRQMYGRAGLALLRARVLTAN